MQQIQLPHVQLQVDPEIQQVASSVAGTKNFDWQALGLANHLTDDDALNRLQSGVSQWITQIRKLTVLPKSTPFPMIAEESNLTTFCTPTAGTLESTMMYKSS